MLNGLAEVLPGPQRLKPVSGAGTPAVKGLLVSSNQCVKMSARLKFSEYIMCVVNDGPERARETCRQI